MPRINVTDVFPDDGSEPYFSARSGPTPFQVLVNYPLQDGRLIGFVALRYRAVAVVQESLKGSIWRIIDNPFQDIA